MNTLVNNLLARAPTANAATPLNRASNSDFLVGDMAESPGKDPASIPETENTTTNDEVNVLGYLTIGKLMLGQKK